MLNVESVFFLSCKFVQKVIQLKSVDECQRKSRKRVSEKTKNCCKAEKCRKALKFRRDKSNASPQSVPAQQSYQATHMMQNLYLDASPPGPRVHDKNTAASIKCRVKCGINTCSSNICVLILSRCTVNIAPGEVLRLRNLQTRHPLCQLKGTCKE